MGKNKARLDEFFSNIDSYNDEMLYTYFKDKYNEQFDMNLLGWYSRLELGQKIHDFMIENDNYCEFRAEL